MARLDIQRQQNLEPKRLEYAKKKIENLGYDVKKASKTELQIEYLNQTICFFPYSGWHTGKNIQDGRGLKKLLNQIK